jgi:hypothetical protein
LPGLPDAKENLKHALAEAKSFSERASQESCARCFANALVLLDDPSPAIPFHPDLLPPSFSELSSRQLLAGACQAWVFGGMASWNDLNFANSPLQNDYNSITVNLYKAVTEAITAASNLGGESDMPSAVSGGTAPTPHSATNAGGKSDMPSKPWWRFWT